MNTKFSVLALTLALVVPMAAAEEGNVLTGDKRLACEAILCLSSGQKPSECKPSLERYFGIKKKKASDTIKARVKFLEKCPASSEGDMKQRIKEIANGAGRCDAAFLNQTLREQWVLKERAACGTGKTLTLRCNNPTWTVVEKRQGAASNLKCGRNELNCRIRVISIIDKSKPGYCTAYEDSDYADRDTLGTVYVGDPWTGGHWEDK
jgi:hypothetical protein